MADSEKVLHEKMIRFLKRYFYVFSEVWSDDKTSRIDLVILHHSDKERKYPIGIEIKVKEKKTGRSLADWLRQAIRYTENTFKGFGKCLIITCPQISGYYLKEGSEMHQHEDEKGCREDHNASTFLGQFKIGEFQKYIGKFDKQYMRIVYKGSIIWDMKDNILRMHNYERLCK